MTDQSTSAVPNGFALTPLNPAYQRDPVSLLDEVREAGRVLHDPQLGRHIVSRFEDVQAVLNDRDLAVDPRKAAEGSYSQLFLRLAGETTQLSMLFLDPPDHTRLRALVSKAFTPRAIKGMRPRIEAIAGDLLARVEGDGPFDLMEAFCQPFPTIVIAEMLGVDAGDQADFKRWTDASVAALFDPFASPEMRESAKAASGELEAYLRRAIAARRASPSGDLITGLVQAEEDGSFLNDDEVVLMIALLLGAGNITTTDLLGNGMKNLLEHPEQAQLLREQPSLIEHAVEEMLRFEGPVTYTGRITVDERPIAGCPMHAGQSITLSLAGANYDPRLHEEPHRFDVTRQDIDHLAFGGGRRYCLGAPLARLEAEIGVRALLERFPKLRLAEQTYEWKTVPGFRGLKRLLVLA